MRVITNRLVEGQEGRPYVQVIEFADAVGNVTIAVHGDLPHGLYVNQAAQAIMGTPDLGSAEIYPIVITGEDSAPRRHNHAQPVAREIKINPAPAPPAPPAPPGAVGTLTLAPVHFAPTVLEYNLTVGDSISGFVEANGGTAPYDFEVGKLPPGGKYTVRPNGIRLGGTALRSGRYSTDVLVTDANDDLDEITLRFNVSEPKKPEPSLGQQVKKGLQDFVRGAIGE